MRYRIYHTTQYTYGAAASLSQNEVRLLPGDHDGQTCHSASLEITPLPDCLRERRDFFGNRVSFFTLEYPHESLTVTMKSDVTVAPPEKKLPSSPAWDALAKFLPRLQLPLTDVQFLMNSPLINVSASLRAYAEPSFPPGRPALEAVEDLNHRIFTDFDFVSDVTDITTPLEEVMEKRAGVCQDFAQIGIGCVRAMGLPARYVSGYIETLPAPGQPKLIGADASHAWLGVLIPELGWFGFDPTNDQRRSERHVVVAHGRDFTDATPLKGVTYGGGQQTLSVEVDVSPFEPGIQGQGQSQNQSQSQS